MIKRRSLLDNCAIDLVGEIMFYGLGNWKKMKGVAHIRLSSGKIKLAELHWYEAHGIGKKEIKRKRYLE